MTRVMDQGERAQVLAAFTQLTGEAPDQETSEARHAFGQLTEGIHIAEYAAARACDRFEYLLENGRWMKCGFTDISAFLERVDLSGEKIPRRQRRRIAAKLEAAQASLRDAGQVLGVSHETVRKDIATESGQPLKRAVGGNSEQSASPPKKTVEKTDTCESENPQIVNKLTEDAFASLADAQEKLRLAVYAGDEHGISLCRKNCIEAERVLRACGERDRQMN